MTKEWNLSDVILDQTEINFGKGNKIIFQDNKNYLLLSDVREFIRRLKDFAKIYRNAINEELKDERILAHLYTCITKWEDFIQKLAGEKLNEN